MILFRLNIVVLILLNFSNLRLKASDTINISIGNFNIDSSLKLVIVNQDVNLINEQYHDLVRFIRLDSCYRFENNITGINLGMAFNISSPAGHIYKLYFTKLPIIHINTNHTIIDEDIVFAGFTLNETDDTKASLIGIEYRGGFSQTVPKKSFLLKFYSDTVNAIKSDVQLLGMRSDNEWNLQAIYNEPLRYNSKSAFELWGKINKLHYQDLEPDAVNGISFKYVELLLNGHYQGIYALTERIDRKQLKLIKYDNAIRGELYKGISWGASTYTACPHYNNDTNYWSGFEFEYPKDLVYWENLYGFVDFVINEPDTIFFSSYKNKFDIDNAVDYFIFLNLVRATDNTGKNIFVAKYDYNTPYFYVPWDLDGTFGIIWDGTKENITNDILLNGFYKRLIHDCSDDGFTERIKNRWKELRLTILSGNEIKEIINSNFEYLSTNGVYEREGIAWPGYIMSATQLQYTYDWLEMRLKFLDDKFSDPCLSFSTSIDKSENQYITLEIYPNPAHDVVIITSKIAFGETELIIYNSMGAKVYEKKYSGHIVEIDVSDFSAGIYLVTINNWGKRKVSKMIIQ